jgi:glycosyltransferase involved in cell wall biosynthesis
MEEGISIIICCYNSASRIEAALEFLAKQDIFYPGRLEVIIVDNASTDATALIAGEKWKNLDINIPFQIAYERNPGLNHARECGAAVAKYEILIFCDDDNWLRSDYSSLAYDLMQKHPEIGVLAGQSIPVSDVGIPNWFYCYQAAYACGVLAPESGNVTEREWVWGAGMVVRKSLYLNLLRIFKHKTSDRMGESLFSGGDTEICYWHILAGYNLWYEEGLVLNHYMPKGRLTKDYFQRLKKGHSVSAKKLGIYHEFLLGLKLKSKFGFFYNLLNYLKKSYKRTPCTKELVSLFPFSKPFMTEELLQLYKSYRKANLFSSNVTKN